MSALQIHVAGVGLLGPGMESWARGRDVLAGKEVLRLAPTQLPPATALPPAERRRVGAAIKLSMAIGFEATSHAGSDPKQLATVFSSTEGDCDNCHAILETLASDERAISPTRFHNSVHNAPSGYWSIATGCMQPSTSLCAFDATFAAGLLEAATQALSSGQSCMLLAYDTAFPEPLYSLRPIPYAMGVALVLSPIRTAATLATLTLALCDSPATAMPDPELEALRRGIPAARSLPLLSLLAQQRSGGAVVIDYLDALRLHIEVTHAA